MLFRYELLDQNNQYKGELDNIVSASISYDAEAEIKRTAKFELIEKNIKRIRDRVVELEDELIHNIWEGENVVSTDALRLAPSPNLCPPFEQWFLRGNAEVTDGVLDLKDYTAVAESPLIEVDGDFVFSADYFSDTIGPEPWEVDYPYYVRRVEIVYHTEELETISTPLTYFNQTGFNWVYTNISPRQLVVQTQDKLHSPSPLGAWERGINRSGKKAKYIKIIFSLDANWTPSKCSIRKPMLAKGITRYMPYGGYFDIGTAEASIPKPKVGVIRDTVIQWDGSEPAGTKLKIEVTDGTEWVECTNGGNIPYWDRGVNTEEIDLKYRVTLEGAENTPSLSEISLWCDGYGKKSYIEIETDNIHYPSDRIKPYMIEKTPDREEIVEAEYSIIHEGVNWRRGSLVHTVAPDSLELAPSPNICPPFDEWTLTNAQVQDGILRLDGYNSKAESPLITVGEDFTFSADFFSEEESNPWELGYPYFATKVDVVYYADQHDTINTPLTLFNQTGFNRIRTNAVLKTMAYSTKDTFHRPFPLEEWKRDRITGRKARYAKIVLSLDPDWTPSTMNIKSPMITTTGEWKEFMKDYRLRGTAEIVLQKPYVESIKSSLIEWEEEVPNKTDLQVHVSVGTGWRRCENGEAIPYLGSGVNLEDTTIRYRVTLTGDGYVTPKLDQLKMYIGGYRKIIIPGEEIKTPLGVFLLSTPTRTIDEAGVIKRNIEAYDQLLVLQEDKTTGTFLIEAGTKFTDAIKNILTVAGITHYNITDTDLELPVDREWEGGTPKLEIINELLEAMNYQPLWFDAEGYAIVRPYERPDVRSVEMTYRDDEEGVFLPTMEETYDFFNVPNRFVLVVSEPEMDEMKSIYTNENPDSPTSTVSRGRVITEYRQVEAPDKETLDSLAERAAYEASQVYQEVKMETKIIPTHSHNNMVRLEYRKLGIANNFEETAWSYDLEAGATMSHTLRRIVPV